MKKISLLLACVSLLLCAACSTQQEPTSTITTATMTTATTVPWTYETLDFTSFEPETSLRKDGLFIYPPDEIILFNNPKNMDIFFDN
jgi:hypothetical protein